MPQRKKPIIVIDPGHGGDDPGAIGASGLKEKDVTLMSAQELKASLEATGFYTVYLTRSDDRFIILRERTKIAQTRDADLFISLHADAAISPRAFGASVYTLSEKSSDKEAEMLANKENKADIIHGVDLSNTSDEVSSILIDLVQRETMNQSAAYANLLVKNLKDQVKLKKDTHRFAGFMVLKAPDTPAVLLELGFLSNPKEEWLLKQRSYRAKIIRGITKATNSYFKLDTLKTSAAPRD
jgi:N-acetylmuramoyl-L-alanine amidase